jgi:hypothetical protein
MGRVEGQAVPGAGPLQTFARAAVDVRCSSTDTKLSQCTGVYSTAPRTCYPARVICHSHKLGGWMTPAQSTLGVPGSRQGWQVCLQKQHASSLQVQ